MSISTDLFPAKNREAASVAFLRTFWQAVTGSSVVATVAGYIAVVSGVIHVDWVDLGYAVGGIVAVGVLSGAKAAGNILVNGLPATYQALAVAATDSAPAPAEPAPAVADAGVPVDPTTV